ncbi:MAG: hypothetical protein IE932_09690 [Sphingopyxis terrae]|nr:hypothetical protein [Sphingopyxis terrae]
MFETIPCKLGEKKMKKNISYISVLFFSVFLSPGTAMAQETVHRVCVGGTCHYYSCNQYGGCRYMYSLPQLFGQDDVSQ